MCELLGLCFNKQVTVNVAFSGLREGAADNPDGWGVAWYDEHGVQIVKEARPVDRSRLAASFMEDLDAHSRIFVSHIRRGTTCPAGYLNTHPFCRMFGGRTWVLAHNGTVKPDEADLPVGGFTPAGETDSERVFCGLLSWLDREGIRLDCGTDFIALHEKLGRVNAAGELNLVFSDGVRLFAYHDMAGHVGMHFVFRHAPYDVVTLRARHLTADLARLAEPDERGYIVASQPLSDEDWTRVEPGRLMVFEDGEMVFKGEWGQGRNSNRPES